jgi:hypothetical protein
MFLADLFKPVGKVIPGIGEQTPKGKTLVIDLYAICFEDDIESFKDWIHPDSVCAVKVSCRAACMVIHCKVYEMLKLTASNSSLGSDDFNRAALILYTGKTEMVLHDEYESLVQDLESDILQTQAVQHGLGNPQPVMIVVVLITGKIDRHPDASPSTHNSEPLDLESSWRL